MFSNSTSLSISFSSSIQFSIDTHFFSENFSIFKIISFYFVSEIISSAPSWILIIKLSPSSRIHFPIGEKSFPLSCFLLRWFGCYMCFCTDGICNFFRNFLRNIVCSFRGKDILTIVNEKFIHFISILEFFIVIYRCGLFKVHWPIQY